MKSQRIAAWAAQQAAGVASQIHALPKPKDWRDAQRQARTRAALHAKEARFRRMIPEPVDWELPF